MDSWSLFAWGQRTLLSLFLCGGVAGNTQGRTGEEAKTQAGLRRAGDWLSTPVVDRTLDPNADWGPQKAEAQRSHSLNLRNNSDDGKIRKCCGNQIMADSQGTPQSQR